MVDKIDNKVLQPQESPPAYDEATASSSQAPLPKVAPVHQPQMLYPGTTSASGSGEPTVYRYQHPISGHVVMSLLPPNHPQMVCLQRGNHDIETRFGLLGVLAAVFWFPLGVGLCLLDRKARCRQCGEILDSGLCS